MSARAERAWWFALAMLLAVPSAWASPQAAPRTAKAQDWSINAWGARPPDALMQPGSGRQCVSVGGQPGIQFGIRDRRDGTAEMILPGWLQPGKAYRFEAMGSAPGAVSPVQVNLMFRRDGPHYQTAMVRAFELTAQPVRLQMQGIYFLEDAGSVRVSLPRGLNLICLTDMVLREIAPEEVGQPDTSFKVSDRLFGIHMLRLGEHNVWPRFNPGVVRLWDTGTTWNDLQPKPGPINWSQGPSGQRMRYFVQHTLNKGDGADVLMTLGMTPEWAVAEGAVPCNPAPYGRMACHAPAKLDDWRSFVRELGQRFEGRVRLWEVWNEADIPMHWLDGAEALVALQRVAHEELKRISPRNEVIGPNVTTNGLFFLHEMLQAGAARYMDGLSLHAYFGRRPDLADAAIRNVRQMLRDRGLSMPIWNTEVAAGCGLPQECVFGSTAEMVDDAQWALAQGLVGEAALGVVNINYFTLETDKPEHGWVPMLASDLRTTTRFGRFMERLRQWLTGATVRLQPPIAPGVTTVDLQLANGRQCRMMWGARREPIKVDRGSLLPKVTLSYIDGDPVPEGELRVARRPVLACASK